MSLSGNEENLREGIRVGRVNDDNDGIICFDCDTFDAACPSIGICSEGHARFCDCVDDIPDNVRVGFMTGEDTLCRTVLPCPDSHPDAYAVENRTFYPTTEDFRQLGLIQPDSNVVIELTEYKNGWKLYYDDITEGELL